MTWVIIMGTANFNKSKVGVPNFFGDLPKLGSGLADSITARKDVGIKRKR